MAKDYKSRAAKKPQRKQSSGWAWFGAGLAVGLFVAVLVYLKSPQGQGGNVEAHRPPPPEPPKQSQQDTREVHKEAKETPPPPSKPRFDFYTMLPKMEVVIPEQEVVEPTPKPGQPVQPVEKPGTYILQAGSFRKYEEADRLKATIALTLGMQAEIQTVTINGKDTWHRVRLGPYSDLAALNQARNRLKEHDIDAILLRIKG